MALEAVVFPHDMFLHGNNNKEWCSMGGGAWGFGMEEQEKVVVVECGNGGNNGDHTLEICHDPLRGSLLANWDLSCSPMVQNIEEWDMNSSPEARTKEGFPPTVDGRRKRRRTKACKNKEEVENQRMTHIAVERNRRKQMNEYLAVLRSLMPSSYVQRSDQASIIGGAINFVKELEQLLQSLEAEKRIKQQTAAVTGSYSTPFTSFFSFPQYSMCSSGTSVANNGNLMATTKEAVVENRSAAANIEVTMVESHANLKVLSRRRPRQLLQLLVGLQSLRLTLLHLNLTNIEHLVLYSFSVKVEDDCHLNSADEIATAVHGMLCKIQEEPNFFC